MPMDLSTEQPIYSTNYTENSLDKLKEVSARFDETRSLDKLKEQMSRYRQWIKSAGAHSKQGIFYRKIVQRLSDQLAQITPTSDNDFRHNWKNFETNLKNSSPKITDSEQLQLDDELIERLSILWTSPQVFFEKYDPGKPAITLTPLILDPRDRGMK